LQCLAGTAWSQAGTKEGHDRDHRDRQDRKDSHGELIQLLPELTACNQTLRFIVAASEALSGAISRISLFRMAEKRIFVRYDGSSKWENRDGPSVLCPFCRRIRGSRAAGVRHRDQRRARD